ncbi:MAG: WYL domain-containing protein [Chitinophagaceae bacterium]|nr:WYL domain-containing protein [Chitinophagaceae bacterium]
MKRQKITHERRHIRLRLEIIDELLSGHAKRTYPDLLEALGKSLLLKGEVPIQMRMLKNDIAYLENTMDAPIHRPDKKDNRIYYTKRFSLKNVPVDDDDISILKNAVAILKKATNIKLTDEVDEIISRLENKIHTNVPDSGTMIAFEEHTEAIGKEYFDDLFSAIKLKQPVKVNYQPFGKEIREWLIHPYMLKEYRNRWFLIGRVDGKQSLSNLRLDSIKGKIKNSSEKFIENDLFNPETYFNDVIGPTIPKDTLPLDITIKVDTSSADYIRTKPIHKSQVIHKVFKDGSLLITMKLFNNYELKSQLLSYGPAIQVIKPELLRNEMKDIFLKGMELYK